MDESERHHRTECSHEPRGPASGARLSASGTFMLIAACQEHVRAAVWSDSLIGDHCDSGRRNVLAREVRWGGLVALSH
jgi:hypothetical protein